MHTEFIKISVDIYADWAGDPPVYRLYVNDELFTERTYIWNTTQFIQEQLQIMAPVGTYKVRLENLSSHVKDFKFRNLLVTHGNARVIDSKTIEVYNENQ